MDISKLIGMRVMNNNTHAIGRIIAIQNGSITIDYHGTLVRNLFPSAFSQFLELEDEDLQQELTNDGIQTSFEEFKRQSCSAIYSEIDFLKATGGKKNRIVDGELLHSPSGEYLYAFDTDTDFHFPDGTAIKMWFPENIVTGYIVSCEDFTLLIRTSEYLGEIIDSVEFTSEQWQLLEALTERIGEIISGSESIAYQVACNGKKQISEWSSIKSGQNIAFNRATSETITFIWGPPGTGKTETLANIALEHIQNGKRVLMLSYSNVSVDGALLRVSKKADLPAGMVIRYGYPRLPELMNSENLTSYQFVLRKNSEKAAEYKELVERKKKLKRKDPERISINKKLNAIRNFFLNQEKELIQQSAFVATTASKATVDKAVYTQNFDVVIFDEASMAYIPQIVFAASLAQKHFVCIGDFCQLPAIVQNPTGERLSKDIFDHVGITSAVDNNQGHGWLVMLDTQFRMHQDIADFVSDNMYQGRLKTAEKGALIREEITNCFPCLGSAMALIDLSGMYSVCTRTMDGSRINVFSALLCVHLAELNADVYEIGVITPYSAQSRLIMAMIRDIRERVNRNFNVSCATVHQFQGSEKPVIIYDAVDCFRMPYPGSLLTSMKNDTANRLFNVAITRAKGKFLLVCNVDYLRRKKISSKLLFTKAMKQMIQSQNRLSGTEFLEQLEIQNRDSQSVYVAEREQSWRKFIDDISCATALIQIDIPDVINDNDEAICELADVLHKRQEEGVDICLRCSENIDLPITLQPYLKHYEYVTNPISIIDKHIIWFGQPLYAADFISEGEILDTEVFPCIRFDGKYTTRLIQAFLEM